MKMQVSGVSGRAVVEFGGVSRSLACDMRAAESLYDAVGELWPYWMVERCVGSLYEIAGQNIRVADQLPKEELAVLVIGLLASDRARTGRIDTVNSVLEAIGEENLLDAQKAAICVVQPCFSIPGKGLVKEKRRRARKRKDPWDWKRVLETAFGPLRLRPEVFWSLTLVEWHTLQNGYAESERIDMRKRAWQSRYQLIAGGANPEDVTLSKLLGQKDTRRGGRGSEGDGDDMRFDRNSTPAEKQEAASRVVEALRAERAKRDARAEVIGKEAEAAEYVERTRVLQEKARKEIERRWRKEGR